MIKLSFAQASAMPTIPPPPNPTSREVIPQEVFHNFLLKAYKMYACALFSFLFLNFFLK
jgi:hypothetical protein